MEFDPEQVKRVVEKAQQSQETPPPPWYCYAQQEILPQVVQNYLQLCRARSKEAGAPVSFPIEEFGLSCYIQAQTDLLEALSDLGMEPPEILDTDPESKKVARNAFDAMRQAWLQTKYQAAPGSVPERSPDPPSRESGLILP